MTFVVTKSPFVEERIYYPYILIIACILYFFCIYLHLDNCLYFFCFEKNHDLLTRTLLVLYIQNTPNKHVYTECHDRLAPVPVSSGFRVAYKDGGIFFVLNLNCLLIWMRVKFDEIGALFFFIFNAFYIVLNNFFRFV